MILKNVFLGEVDYIWLQLYANIHEVLVETCLEINKNRQKSLNFAML